MNPPPLLHPLDPYTQLVLIFSFLWVHKLTPWNSARIIIIRDNKNPQYKILTEIPFLLDSATLTSFICL